MQNNRLAILKQTVIDSLIETRAGTNQASEDAQALRQAVDLFEELVLKHKEKEFHSLVALSQSKLTVEKLKILQTYLLEEITEKKGIIKVLTVFSRWIEVGNELGYWKFCPPSWPVQIKSAVSPFDKSARAYTDIFAKLEDALVTSIHRRMRQKKVGDADFLLGQLLLSAILFGDIRDRVSLKALLAHMGESFRFGDVGVWLDLGTGPSAEVMGEVRRWFPDPMSELLYYCRTSEMITLANTLVQKNSTEANYRCVRKFLREVGVESTNLPSSFRALYKVASYRRMMDSSPVMSDYGQRKFVAHSLRPNAWARISGNKIVGEAVPVISDEEPQTASLGQRQESVKGIVEPVWWRDFHREVFNQKQCSHKACAKRCRQFLNKMPASKTANYLVPLWIEDLLTTPRKLGKKLAVGTIKGMLSSTGKRLVSMAGHTDITQLASSDYEDLYWQILEDIESASLRRSVAKGLIDFHEFLVKRYGTQSLGDWRAIGLGPGVIPVDANVITVDEYEEILGALRKDRILNSVSPSMPVLASLVTMIGFRCGARRSEVFKLRLRDYHPGGSINRTRAYPELLIRPWQERGLKTQSSRRRLPLYALLTEEERRQLDSWYQQRMAEEERIGKGQVRTDACLFVLPVVEREGISVELLFSHIHRVMREVTGDKSIRFHHLRHSFASWFSLGLLLSDLSAIPAIFPKSPKMQAWLESIPELKKGLLRRETASRKYIYAVSSLLGHSGPAMSMEHYIHTLDLAEFYTRRQRFGAELLRKIEPISQAAIYQKRAHKDTDKLLEVVRSNYKQKTRRGVVVADEGTSGEAVSSGFQQLTALYTFLSRAAGMDESAIESLGNEYEYGFDRASRYVKVAKFICGLTTGWRGTSRFKIPENALVPSWRLSETEENNMAVVAEAAYGLIAADKRRVQEVCHDYIHRVCSRNGIIYGRKSEPAAQVFIDFIRYCDIPPQQIQLAFYRGGAAKAKSAWLKAFKLRKKCMIDEIVPSNVNSDTLKDSVRIKVLMEVPGNYPKASQTRFLNLLMFLVSVEVLERDLD